MNGEGKEWPFTGTGFCSVYLFSSFSFIAWAFIVYFPSILSLSLFFLFFSCLISLSPKENKCSELTHRLCCSHRYLMCSPKPWKASSSSLSTLLSSRWSVESMWMRLRASEGNDSMWLPVRVRDCRFSVKEINTGVTDVA